MKKEIINREPPQNHILYEQAEPLFPPLKGGKLRRIIRAAVAFAVFCAVVAVCIFVGVSLSSASGGGGNATDGQTTAALDTRDTTESTDTESDDITQSDETESQSETLPIHNGEGDVTEDQTEESTLGDIVEREQATDISLIEKGECYVDNYTSKKLDVEGLLDRGFIYSEPTGSKAPVVMVIHTHTSEQYSMEEGSTGYKLNSVVAAGERIVTVLNARGLATVHCTVIHDGDEANAYLNARDTIKTMIEIYPSIKYVIDVHRMVVRDASGNELRTQTTQDGAAQMRLTVSADIKREGAWQDDVSLALTLRSKLNQDGQRACAPVVVSHGGYNGDICNFHIMVDIGSSSNTVDEAMRAADKLAIAFADVVVGR